LVAEECARLLNALPDASLRQVAILKMEGYRNEEIAGRLGCSLQTVARRLKVIRRAWQEEGSP
jgi:DNA-directed RNA polymerase specialized sigma24 family protein